MDYLLIDVRDNTAYDFIVPRARHRLVPVRPPRLFKQKEAQWLLGVLKVLRKSRKEDRIVCLFDFQAVLAWWICHLTGMKRKFICVNLLLDQRNTRRNRLVSALYRKALPAQNFQATVTSEEYGSWLNRNLGIKVSYPLLRDVFHSGYEVVPGDTKTDVFCGGRNGRDWDFLLALAVAMPDVSFTAVAPPAVRRSLEKSRPRNLQLLSNLPSSEFAARLAASSVVCLPLVKQAPAGLIVLFQAAANHRPVIVSDTVTTRAYCADGRGILLGRDTDSWCKAIRHCIQHPSEVAEMADKLLAFCESECSEQVFVNTLDTIM